MEEIEFSWWLFEGRLRQGKNVLSDGLNWLCYFAGNSKSHHENSISFIFLESPYQVDMKNVVKSSKHFFGYFNTLETHSAGSPQAVKVIKLSCPSFRILWNWKKAYLVLFFIPFSVHNLAYGLDWSSNQWWKYLSCHYRCAIPKNISGMKNFILYFHKIIKSAKN